MAKQIVILATDPDDPGLRPLLDACATEGFQPRLESLPATPEALGASLPPPTPAVYLVPAIEEDLLGVKMIQALRGGGGGIVVAGLYAYEMPPAEFLCTAFREGAEDVVVVGDRRNAMEGRLRRFGKRLSELKEHVEIEDQNRQRLQSLQKRCELLERGNARLLEKLLALAATAFRVATGELRLAEEKPLLLVLAASQQQASNAMDVGQRLGFDTEHCSNATEALERIRRRPPRVILSDGVIPDMPAPRFAAAARAALKDTPPVIVAWSSNRELEETLMEPGSDFDDFVLKHGGSEGVSLLSAAFLGGLR